MFYSLFILNLLLLFFSFLCDFVQLEMSVTKVPLSFRDWWDDFETPFRSHRLLDQEFGTGLRRDDLLSSLWSGTPSLLRSGYIRPWRTNDIKRQGSGSTLNVDNDKFQVILDVQQFTPSEITVKTSKEFVVVEGKHEEKADEHGYAFENSNAVKIHVNSIFYLSFSVSFHANSHVNTHCHVSFYHFIISELQ